MSDIAIRVENLGKKYRIGGRQERYKRFTETLMDTFYAPIRRLKNLGKPVPPEETIWALKDVSFEIKRGEAVGVIGRNGAGKSTLLKILSRITEPTEGRVELHGRVGSLLEVGTGFHPELTGRENIYLNGAILGMKRAEIDRKFDEIVEFAEIQQFLDTPVKRYSSGMYVRLAFAVAAHLDPEILLVDEVLAVGDAAFQKKCLGKMSDVAGEGRTVLFVSHNMGSIEVLCSRCILLRQGKVQAGGEARHVVRMYLGDRRLGSGSWRSADSGPVKTPCFEVVAFRLVQGDGYMSGDLFSKSDRIGVEMSLNVTVSEPSLNVGYAIYDDGRDACLWWSFYRDCDDTHRLRAGLNSLRTSIPSGLLNDGRYTIEIIAALHNQTWLLSPGAFTVALPLVISGGALGSSMLSGTRRPGVLFPAFEWQVESDD